MRFWASTNKMTFDVEVKEKIIINSAPIGKKFIGQRFENLLRWMKKQGGLKVYCYDNGRYIEVD